MFYFKCPKCKSSHGSIETMRGKLTNPYVTGSIGACYACQNCGKRLFGDVLLREYQAQKSLWEASEASRLSPPTTPQADVARPLRALQQALAEVPRGKRRPLPRRVPSPVALPPVETHIGEGGCQYEKCSLSAKEGRKYCSDKCCANQARLKYKRKKQVLSGQVDASANP